MTGETASKEERLKILMTQKRNNLSKLKKIKRSYVKAKMEKKRINKEIKELQKAWSDEVAANPELAKDRFAQIVKAVTNDDIFPRDLEDVFNKIEHDHLMGKKRSMKIEDLSNDKGLKIPKSIVDVIQKELDADLEEDTKTVETEEVDDDTKALLVEQSEAGLSDVDLFIDEHGQETEAPRKQ